MLLAGLVLLTCPYPIWLRIRLAMLEFEARRVIAHVEGIRSKTGSYPASLAGDGFRWGWMPAYFCYTPGFELRWWAEQPGVSHWYTPGRGFDYYPD